jgi:hypothetical protein
MRKYNMTPSEKKAYKAFRMSRKNPSKKHWMES